MQSIEHGWYFDMSVLTTDLAFFSFVSLAIFALRNKQTSVTVETLPIVVCVYVGDWEWEQTVIV